MNKNSKLHFAVETEVFESLKKEAEQTGLSISALCRSKLKEYSKLTRIELILEDIQRKLRYSNKFNTGG